MITLKSSEDLAKMRVACNVLKLVHQELRAMIKPGITGVELDKRAAEIIRQHQCEPNFKGLYGFPATICVSINDVLVHGIPNNTPLKNGDLVSIDAGCAYQGFNSDGAFTMIVGEPLSELHHQLVEVTKNALDQAIAILKPGVRIGDIGHVIQEYVEGNGFFLPQEFTGHGIGKELHEDPHIPNVGEPHTGLRLQAGMTICIEPMVQIGTAKIKMLSDGWTPVSVNGLPSAHFEHTILITETGHEVLT
ncbi:type I methionyl aminopeptidase [Spiroplasma sp. DGKH1]|uniref:type I methionyl aminopeptidase n=1 Tax=Spiroplasma sp. DGKH1 TaxID=3050074 RepID=UPI0034C6A211